MFDNFYILVINKPTRISRSMHAYPLKSGSILSSLSDHSGAAPLGGLGGKSPLHFSQRSFL